MMDFVSKRLARARVENWRDPSDCCARRRRAVDVNGQSKQVDHSGSSYRQGSLNWTAFAMKSVSPLYVLDEA